MPSTDSALWSTHLQRTLEAYDEPLLRQVANKLCKPRSQWPAAALIARCLATSSKAAAIGRRLDDLEPSARRLLALIGHSRQARWTVGSLVELMVALGEADGLQPVMAVLEAGLLYPELIPLSSDEA